MKDKDNEVSERVLSHDLLKTGQTNPMPLREDQNLIPCC
jgi:hypothetical protein